MSFVAVESFSEHQVATRIIVVCNDQVLVTPQNQVLIDTTFWNTLGVDEQCIKGSSPLGVYFDEPCEAIYLKSAISPAFEGQFYWQALRPIMGLVSDEVFFIAGRATQLGRWLAEHQYCGKCGHVTRKAKTDRALVCTQCELRFYPKISPCVMVLVTRGDECLLASGVRHKEGMYTALAGFVEAGETVEQAGMREVMEEVNIEIEQMVYFGSQPWPFPGQLMMAYTAEYKSGAITIDDKEIIDAKWYRYDDLPTIPPTSTIARQLIDSFVKSRKKGRSE